MIFDWFSGLFDPPKRKSFDRKKLLADYSAYQKDLNDHLGPWPWPSTADAERLEELEKKTSKLIENHNKTVRQLQKVTKELNSMKEDAKPKAVDLDGSWSGVKDFRPRKFVQVACPKCGAGNDVDVEMSEPVFGTQSHIYFCCGTCDAELQIEATLRGHIEIGGVEEQ